MQKLYNNSLVYSFYNWYNIHCNKITKNNKLI